MSYDLYNKRLTLHGNTQRERNIYDLKHEIQSDLPNNPSYKEVVINGVQSSIVVKKTQNNKIYEFQAMPNTMMYVGMIIEMKNCPYMVISTNKDDEVYMSGKIQECNKFIKWIERETGEIRSSYAIKTNATQYNSGEWHGEILTVGNAQHRLWLPCNKETLLLDNGYRLMIDKSKINPRVYTISQRDTSTHNDLSNEEYGIVEFMLSETTFDKNTDSAEYMIADYYKYKKNNNITPPITDDCYIKFTKNETKLVDGEQIEIQATVVENNIELDNFVWTWNVEYPIANIEKYFNVTINNNKIKIEAQDIPYNLLPLKLNVNVFVVEKNINATTVVSVCGIFD